MQTILVVIGTRPEAIKLAPVVRQLQCRDDCRTLVCSTGQHRELLAGALNLFQIRPDIELELMQPGQSLADLTARLIPALDGVLVETRPDWLLAQGDTTTVLAAALAAYYRGVRFGHVEAGLRTGDLRQPFPEELNRRVADQTAELLFAPTEQARRALLAEGHAAERIRLTGNTVIDALQHVAGLPYDWSAGPLRDFPPNGRLVLVTAHRRESFGAPLESICRAIADLAQRFADVQFVYPVHPNPEVRQTVRELLSGIENVSLLDPLDYLSFVQLMRRSALIMTDSGGIQEEAPALGVPVLVLRETTERPEGIVAGVARLVGTDQETIVSVAGRLLTDEPSRLAMARAVNPYGDGHAAERIVAAVCGIGETGSLAAPLAGRVLQREPPTRAPQAGPLTGA